MSYQQIIDCVGVFKTFEDYFTYLVFAGGLEAASTYPNTGTKGLCKFIRADIKQKVSHYYVAGPYN